MLKTDCKTPCLWGLIAALVVLDILTKLWATEVLTLNTPQAVIPYLNLTLVHNEGAAFSFLSNQGGWQRWLLSGISFVVIVLFTRWMVSLKPTMRLQRVSLALIIGGAIGNLIDRLFTGYVIDFIDVYVNEWHWPAFNLADSVICIGVFFLLISMIGEQRDKT